MKSVFALIVVGLFVMLPAAPAMAVQDFPLPTGDAGLIEAGQGPTFGNKGITEWNGSLVFAEEDANQLGFIDTDGQIDEVPIAEVIGTPENGPFALSTVGGGDLWMLSAGAPLEGRVTRFNPDAGITYWNLGYTRVVSIAADSQGGAWVTNQYGEGISYFDSDNNEHFFDSPEYTDPAPVTVAGDGAAWFGDGSTTIKRITRTGNLQNFHASGDGEIVSLTKGPDGAVWYAKFEPGGGWLGPPASGGIIGRLSLGGSPKLFKTPMEDMTPSSLITGKDGALWFTTRLGEGIGRMTTSGKYSFASLPGGRKADSIAFGPDGAIWYTDSRLNRIGRMTVAEFNQANKPRKPVILSRGLKAKRKRFTKVKIGCPAGPAPCRGKIEIHFRGKLIARGSYQMPVGKKSAGAASFNRLGRKLLGKSRVLKVTIVLKAGKAGKVSRRMKLRR
jgi:virginiamycin B lyase